ncbi:hypothetical protein RQM47_11950 [Rubrivirga sp. S365]|uniref:Uncharacterized protein n=1 Tax=Rubrivirga litoralis TaxID=3075598 RepID=A0ABU3BNE6_9BACT|nr:MULTISPECIES: hypothetical protein [unclassified Rubrivirga]MDT0630804.1 hypothetical protein [Rubrivirga sp. F394]MDT7857355.1 hypothetical protein [Rubrivirga sp. S365]
MTRLRRALPVLAALLAVVVAVQATDLVACADEAEAAEHGEAHTDASFAPGAHPAPAPGDAHGADGHAGAFADCLCHVVFAPTGVVPDVGARLVGGAAAFAAFVAAPPEVEPLGLDHVPLV